MLRRKGRRFCFGTFITRMWESYFDTGKVKESGQDSAAPARGRLCRLPVSIWSLASTYSRPLEQVRRSKCFRDSALTNTGALLIFCCLWLYCTVQSVQPTMVDVLVLPAVCRISINRTMQKSCSKASNIETRTFSWQPAPPKNHSVTKCRRLSFLFCVISSETFSGGYQSICLRSQIKGDGWRRTDAKVSYFWDAVCLRYGLAPIWKSQSRSHQRGPFRIH